MKRVALFLYVFAGRGIIDVSAIDPTLTERIKSRIEKRSQDIKKEFAFILNDENRSAHFRAMLLHLNTENSLSLEKILFTEKNPISKAAEAYLIPEEKMLEEVFKQKNGLYGYFAADDSAAIKRFMLIYKFLQLASNYLSADNSQHQELYECAYKTLVCFNHLKSQPDLAMLESIEAYLLSRQNSQPTVQSLPEIMDLQIDKKNNLHFDEWTQFIAKYGTKALNFFKRAQDIEAQLQRAPRTPKEAFEALAQIDYPRYHEYPELAQVCEQYNVPESVFNRCLDLEVNKLWKTKDNLPKVMVNGSNPDIGQPGYFLVKLPNKDPRALILGYITNDCQSIGSKGETCVLDGISSEHNGFYVLLKSKDLKKENSPFLPDERIDYEHFELIGQGYAWMSMAGNFTLDSWENARQKDDSVVVPMLMKFAQEVLLESNGAALVTIGQKSPRTPAEFRDASPMNYPELMEEGTQYLDSKSQVLLAVNEPKIKEIQEELMFELLENGGFEATRALEQLVSFVYTPKQNIWVMHLLASECLDWHSEEVLARIGSCVVNDNSGGVITWKALFLLEQAQLLNEHSFQQITKNEWEAKSLCEAIITLGKANLLTAENLNILVDINNGTIIGKSTVLDELSAAAVQLSRAQIQLDNERFSALAHAYLSARKSRTPFNQQALSAVISLKSKFDIDLDSQSFMQVLGHEKQHLSTALDLLAMAKQYKMNILDNETYKNIIKNAAHLSAFNWLIPQLASRNLLDNASFQLLINQAQEKPYLAKVLLLLSDNDLLDKETFAYLTHQQLDFEQLHDALSAFHEINALDRTKVQFILEHQNHLPHFAQIFDLLERANLLSQERFDLIKSALHSLPEVTKILSLLDKYELLDETNFSYVMDNAGAAPELLKGLKKLKGDNKLDGDHWQGLKETLLKEKNACPGQENVLPSVSAKEVLQKLKNPIENNGNVLEIGLK